MGASCFSGKSQLKYRQKQSHAENQKQLQCNMKEEFQFKEFAKVVKGPTLESIQEKQSYILRNSCQTTLCSRLDRCSNQQISHTEQYSIPSGSPAYPEKHQTTYIQRSQQADENIKEQQVDYLQALQKALFRSDSIDQDNEQFHSDEPKSSLQKVEGRRKQINPYIYIKNKPIYIENLEAKESLSEIESECQESQHSSKIQRKMDEFQFDTQRNIEIYD